MLWCRGYAIASADCVHLSAGLPAFLVRQKCGKRCEMWDAVNRNHSGQIERKKIKFREQPAAN